MPRLPVQRKFMLINRMRLVLTDRILKKEKEEGLNGHLLLIHFGTDPLRTDKFYNGYLDKLISVLKKKGYKFTSIPDALGK